MVLVWHPRCRQAAPGLLQTTMQIEWPTMSKMQNDCFGMTGLWWQYHHDHILKGRLFGRLVWLFFPVLHVYGWGGHRRWASRPRGPSGFKLLFYVTMGRTNSRFRRNVLWGGHRRWASRPRGPSGFNLLFYVTMGLTNSRFSSKCLAHHVNVRKQNLDSQNESETCTIFSVRSGGFFFTRSCMLLLTLLQHCAPSFAQNRFVMYITHVHRYVCYVFHLIMYKISFLCWLGLNLCLFSLQ